jgi:hypothetical protein
MPAPLKDMHAVAVSDPLELARLAFGSVNRASRVLELNSASFYNWTQSRGIPLSVYRTIEVLAPGTIPPLATQRVVRNTRAFLINSSVVKKTKKELGPYRRYTPTAKSVTVEPPKASGDNDALELRVAKLEAENTALRERFNRIAAALV